MKKTLLFFALITNSLIAQDCSYIDDLMPKHYKAKDLDCLMISSVQEYSKLIPQKIDDITTLNKVSYNKNSKTFNFNYTMYTNIDKVSKKEWHNTHKYLSKSIINENCNTPNLRLFFDYGLTYKHIYKDKNNNIKFTVLVNNKVCEKL